MAVETAMLGQNVIWYPDGLTNEGNGLSAKVIKVDQSRLDGPLTVQVVPETGGLLDPMKATKMRGYHVGHPHLVKHQDTRIDSGAWDTVEAEYGRRVERLKSVKKVQDKIEAQKTRNLAAGKYINDKLAMTGRVLELHRNKKTAPQIMKELNLGKRMVEEIIHESLVAV